MARITDRLVVQRVDNLIVFMDDSTGAEITMPIEAVPNLTSMLVYLGGEFYVGDLWTPSE